MLAERSFMQFLEGGCSIPLGVRCEFVDSKTDKLRNREEEDGRCYKRQKLDSDDSKTKEDVDNDKESTVGEQSNKVTEVTEGGESNSDEQCNVREKDRDNEPCDDLDDISQLKLSGVVISLDGQRCVQLDCQLKDVDLDAMNNDKIDCTKIVLPTNKCPRMKAVREQFYSCAKLGIQLARQLQTLGAQTILDEINKNRKPVLN